jgi:histidinol dehydrogenase
METILNPDKSQWGFLCKRPGFEKDNLETAVKEILERVRKESDKAIDFYSMKFDGHPAGDLKVTAEEIEQSAELVPQELKEALKEAKRNIETFHAAQLKTDGTIETTEGVRCWRKNVAIEKVGLYIPGGSAPLFSTLLMLGIPAKIAGCKSIIVFTPPGKNGEISPVILFTARLLGISEVYRVGGAQAVAAMAYGTETIPAVYKIFGPGNQYVTKAKELVQMEGVAIDMPAGPSEVLVIADDSASPEFVAADLLSQAEHGADSQVILLSNSLPLIQNVRIEIDKQVMLLPRKEIAIQALENSRSILLSSPDECMSFSNYYAPEHLIINTRDCNALSDKVINAGSVFLGPYSCESAGDYASGTNHTLPTNGYARMYSGLSTESFMKRITFQEISSEGMNKLGPVIEKMAEAESLSGHRNAVSVRLKSLKNG